MASPSPRRRPRLLAWLLAFISLLVMAVVVFVYLQLQASLPRLTGDLAVAGIEAPVEITRDADGVPTIAAASERDGVYALGFLHAQERFFQMDLLRRAGAGELAELLGPAVLRVDKERRIHRLRARAHRAIEALPPDERALLDAYTAGVTAGLADLGSPSFEYTLLGVDPAPWRAEDILCVAYAMFFTLQDAFGDEEMQRHAIERTLPADLARMVVSPGTRWDAPIDDSALALPALSGSVPPPAPPVPSEPAAPVEPGSNNWAVSGRLSSHGGAMVADDMHLALRMPNIWYRARQVVEGPNGFEATGVTLPGTPLVIAGSNGHIAWGFTNAYIDTSDVVVLVPGPDGDSTYRTPDGVKTIVEVPEEIRIRGAPSETLLVKETIWGPIVGRTLDGRYAALRWIGHDQGGNDLGLRKMTFARTLEAAIEAAHAAGMPNQNVLIAAKDGRIAWTLSGLIPLRPEGCEGVRPTPWADGRCAWTGFATGDQRPTVIDPPGGRLWTANNRILGPETRGPVRYPNAGLGARARQIRDDLRAKDKFSEADLLAIQLDDRAVFLAPWRDLMLKRLRADPTKTALTSAVDRWGGRAATDSVGYRAVKAFRRAVFSRVLDPIFAPIRARVDQAKDINVPRLRPRNVEHIVWRALVEQPKALLPKGMATWDDVLDAAVADVEDEIAEDGGTLDQFTWGEANRLKMRHPLSGAVPFLGRVLDPRAVPLPGDRDMPRVQSPTHGASERFVVSPGKEASGIFHMPGGQASHPLSPYLHAGHEAWVNGEPTPFLPGETKWTFRLTP